MHRSLVAGRRAAAAAAVAISALALTTSSAGAATTIGQAPPATGTPISCSPGTGPQLAWAAGGNSYEVPAGGGVITRWRTTLVGGAAFRVFTGSGSTWTAVVDEERAPAGGVSEYQVRIPVSGGERIGLRLPGSTTGCVHNTGNSGDAIGAVSNGAAPVGTSVDYGAGQPPYLFNVAADVEPDADKDGFGDETQDQCPTNGAIQSECTAPETTITAAPETKTTKPKAKFRFTSSKPGSSFQCRLKGRGLDQAVKAYSPCTSPRKYKNLAPGKYRFFVYATDAAGNADPTPAKHKFTVASRV